MWQVILSLRLICNQTRSFCFNIGYYELSKNGFPFFLGCNEKKMGPGFLGGIKKKTPFPAYYQWTVPLTLNFHNSPCRSKDSNLSSVLTAKPSNQQLKSLSYFQAFATTTISHINDIKCDLQKLIVKYCTKFIYVAIQNTPGTRHHF